MQYIGTPTPANHQYVTLNSGLYVFCRQSSRKVPFTSSRKETTMESSRLGQGG